jgi:hypothetical protein
VQINSVVPDTEQWKHDFKEVNEKQNQQILAIQQDAAAGILNRANVDNAVGAMIHPPGNNVGRSMQIEAINARVASQSGHVIARERRESGIIPQVMPVARGPAVIPAAINPDAIVNVQQRRPALNQIEDDPVIAAFLRGNFSSSHAAASAAPPSANFKVQQEARSVELQNLISQHNFCSKLPDTFPEKGLGFRVKKWLIIPIQLDCLAAAIVFTPTAYCAYLSQTTADQNNAHYAEAIFPQCEFVFLEFYCICGVCLFRVLSL